MEEARDKGGRGFSKGLSGDQGVLVMNLKIAGSNTVIVVDLIAPC